MITKITTVVLSLSCIVLQAQPRDSLSKAEPFGKKKRFGVNIESNPNFYFTIPVSMVFYLSKNQHYLGIGPSFFPLEQSENNPWGFDINYRFIPNGVNKVINFYFSFNMTGVRDIYKGISSIGNSNGSILITEKSFYLMPHIGYGFDVRIFKRIHINQYIGFGLSMRQQTTEKNYTLSPEKNYRDRDGLFSNPQSSLMIHLGIGIDIWESK